MTIKISEDFSKTPGGRYRKLGESSAEEFCEVMLFPAFEELDEKEKLTIDLDGTYGYPASWLEETFGGLARKYGKKEVYEKLLLVSTEEYPLIDEILAYIDEVEKL